MRSNEISENRQYWAKVSGKVVAVLVLEQTGRMTRSGMFRDAWWCRNISTGRRIKVLSPQRFRGPVEPNCPACKAGRLEQAKQAGTKYCPACKSIVG